MALADFVRVAKQTIKKTVLGGASLIIGLSSLAVATPLFLSQTASALQSTDFTATGNAGFVRSSTPGSVANGSGTVSQTENSNGSVGLSITNTGGSYADDGFYYNFGELGNLKAVALEGTGSQYAVNLWFNKDGGDYFVWSGNTFSSVGGDDYGLGSPQSSGGNLAVTDSSSFYMVGTGQTYTLAQLKAGAATGISSSTPVAIWVGITSPSGTSMSATINSFQVITDLNTVTVDSAWAGTADNTVVGAGEVFGVNAFSSIQDGVNAVASGGTVNVAAGTYDAFSVSGKTGITIKGAGAGSTVVTPTSLIDSHIQHKYTSDMKVSVLVNDSSNVTIQGMTIKDNGSAPGSGGPDAMVFWNASTGTLSSDSVTGTYSINGDQTGQAIAVDGSNGSVSLTVSNSSLSGFQKNGIDVIDGNGASSGATDTTTLNVSNTTITGAHSTSAIAQNGIVLWDRGGGTISGNVTGSTISGFQYTPLDIANGNNGTGILTYGTSASVTVSNSTLTSSDLDAANATASGTFNASLNYWGSSNPDFSSLVGQVSDGYGAVTTSPYFTNSAMTTRSDAKVLPDSNGNATANNSHPTVVVTSNSTPINVTVSGGTSSAAIDYSALQTSNTQAVVPQTTIQTQNATVQIQSGTTITASGSWNGVLTAPTIQSAASVSIPTPSGTVATVGTVIEVGSSSVSLTFDKAVRLLIPGQAGMLVGFERNGDFTQITTACAADSQGVGNALPAGGDCYISVGSNMVVWTKHFTTFVTYAKSNTYVVQPGDTMSGIAAKLGLTLSQLEALNPGAGHPAGNFNLILPGDVLKVGSAALLTSENTGSNGGQIGSAISTTNTGNGQVKAAQTGSSKNNTYVANTSGTAKAAAKGMQWYWWLIIAAAALFVVSTSAFFGRGRAKAGK